MTNDKRAKATNGRDITSEPKRKKRPRRDPTPDESHGPARRVILALYSTNYITNTGRSTCLPHLIVRFTSNKDRTAFTSRYFSSNTRCGADRVFASGCTPSDPTLCARLRSTSPSIHSVDDSPHSLPDPFLARFGAEFDADRVLVADVVSAHHLNTVTTNVQHFARDHYLTVTFSTNTVPHDVNELPPVVVARQPFVVQLVKLRLWLNVDNETAPIALVLSGDHHLFGTKLQSFVDPADDGDVLEYGPAYHYFGYNPTTETWIFRERQETALRAFIEKSGIDFPPTTILLL